MMTESSFLGLEFSPLRLEDRAVLSEFLRKHPQRLTGYTFATLAAWRPFFQYEWAFVEPDLLLISCILEPDLHRHLIQPVGRLTFSAAHMIKAAATDLPYSLKIVGASDVFLTENPGFSRLFKAWEDRAVSNYVYNANALALLPGRKYAKKRNLLAQASGLYNWSCQMLNAELIDQCFSVLDAILQEEHPKMEGMLQREWAALECTLHHFKEFGQQGVLISVDNKPVAFSIYEAISPTTVAIHFERALRSYKGLYQVINCETAKVVLSQGFQFINREEDLGDEGLRDAKMSYHPLEIIPAYELTYTNQPFLAD
jgi:uncharacterized protein